MNRELVPQGVGGTSPNRWTWFSPWLIIGSVCILAGILLILAVRNIHREKAFMERSLLSEANVLMRSLEASSRTGMMGMGWGQRQIQLLLEETAQQPDVLYVAVVDASGRVFAHSDPKHVGQRLALALPKPGETVHRFAGGEPESFEVIRSYTPWVRQRGRGAWSMPCTPPEGEDDRGDRFIVVGLDPTPFEQARSQDLHQTLLLFGMLFLVGAAGFLSLTWAQNYRSARRSLRDIRAFTATIVAQMPVGFLATDQAGRIQQTNAAALKILRQERDITGRIEDFPCLLPLVRRLKAGGAIVDQELLWPCSGSPTIPLLVNAALIRDGEQRRAGFVFLFTDMTGIKQLEEQLRRSERLAALGRLAAGVAHEIRNPLSSIKGFATILAGRVKGDESGLKIAAVMEQEVERLNRVVSELLDFARPTEIHKTALPCRELIEHSLRLIERDAAHQHVRVEAAVEPEQLEAEVDPDRFAQVLLNLYLNALQAMDGGGTLRIIAKRELDQLLLSVSDSGSGIPPEHLPHIFDPYFTTKPRGVGLGLANVHKLIEAHGGDIEVASTPGQGTCFTIRLPGSQPSSAN